MNLKTLLTSATLAISCSTAFAQGGNYLNAQLALADVDGFGDGLAVVGTYGWPMPQVHKNFSVEGEFTTTISDPDATFFGTSIEVSYYTLAAYGTFALPLSAQADLRLRGGLLYADIEASSTAFGVRASDSDFGASFGVGITYKLDTKMNFIAEYTIIESDISHLSAGIQYKF